MSGEEVKQVAMGNHPLDKALVAISNQITELVEGIDSKMAESEINKQLNLLGRLGLMYDAVLDSRNSSCSDLKKLGGV